MKEKRRAGEPEGGRRPSGGSPREEEWKGSLAKKGRWSRGRKRDLVLRGLLGEEAALSASTVSRLKEKWHSELEVWQSRSLDDLEVVYVGADGVYVKAGLLSVHSRFGLRGR